MKISETLRCAAERCDAECNQLGSCEAIWKTASSYDSFAVIVEEFFRDVMAKHEGRHYGYWWPFNAAGHTARILGLLFAAHMAEDEGR